MSTKSCLDMSDEELIAEISMLRDRRKQRAEGAAQGHKTRLNPINRQEPKAKRDKKVDAGLSDMLSAILEGNFEMPGLDDAPDAPPTEP